MILAIDMGNTNIVVGGIDENKIYFLERITTDRAKTDLEYAVSIKSILEIHKLESSDIEGAILSSVVPPLNQAVALAVKKITNIDCLMVNYKMNMAGLKIKVENPPIQGRISFRVKTDLRSASGCRGWPVRLPLVCRRHPAPKSDRCRFGRAARRRLCRAGILLAACAK